MKLQTLIIILHLIYLIRHHLHQRNRQCSTGTLITRRTLIVSQIQLLHQTSNPTNTISIIHRSVIIAHVLNSSRYRRKTRSVRAPTAELRLNISTKTSIRDLTRFSTEKLNRTTLPSHEVGKLKRLAYAGGLRPPATPACTRKPGVFSGPPKRCSILGQDGNTGSVLAEHAVWKAYVVVVL